MVVYVLFYLYGDFVWETIASFHFVYQFVNL